MLGFIGDTVEGGFDFLGNIIQGFGTGMGELMGGAFPTAQKQTTVSETVQAAGGSGDTYRATEPEHKSILETFNWAAESWLYSPFAEEFEPEYVKDQRSQQLAEKMGQGEPKTVQENIVGILQTIQNVGETGQQIRTVVDDFMESWGLKPREPISEGPKEIGNSPGSTGAIDTMKTAGAQVSSLVKGIWSNFTDQVKGLFNLGYDQTGTQPVFGITHQIQPTKQTTIGIAVVIGIVIVLFIFGRRK